MKIKTLKILIIVFSIMMMLNGCKKSVKDTPDQGNAYSAPVENNEIGIKTGDITDPAELEKLWQEYFYDAITTVCNARDFNSPEEIDPVSVAQFCWYKYTSEKGAGGLELVNKDSTLRVFPLEIVLKYAKQYFNLTNLDVSKVQEGYEYDAEKNAFIFGLPLQQDKPSYTDKNPWGIHIDRVTRDSDGKITAVMQQYDSYETKRVEINKTLILKQRGDGSMYFAGGKWDYVNSIPVVINGDCTHAYKILGYEGSMEELSMVGEIEDKLIMAYTPFDKEKTGSLMLLNPKNHKVEKILKLEEKLGYTQIKQTPDKLILCLDNKIMAISKELEKLEEVPLPKAILDKISRKPKYDSDGFADIIFGGYDISNDLTKLVYSDEQGVKLYSINDSSEKLLAEVVKATGKAEEDRLLKYYYYWKPKFVAGDKKVLFETLGYECIMNYTLYELEKGVSVYLDIRSEGSFHVIRYDTGLLAVNMPIFNELTQKGEYVTSYLDFKTGIVAEPELKEPGDTGYIIPDYYSYVGQNYAAFVTSKLDYNDNTNNIYYINRLDLKTMELEPKVISITPAEPHILGVLEDGRIMFWYSQNPSIYGICITK